MDDFLVNEEESRISSFGRSISEVLKKGSESTNEEKVPNKRKNKKQSILGDETHLEKNESFIVRIDKRLEIPIRKAILDLYERTGKKNSIRDFISEAVMQYVKQLK